LTIINEPIYVTKPFLPPLEEFQEYLKDIWETKWLTNNGKYHQEFEKALCDYLGVKQIALFSNGTLALVTALQALKVTDEVITTPFSFVASTHALWWNNIKPVFVDIDPNYMNLDPGKIEAAITPRTTAIMPVHVYGNPCNVEEIQRIGDTYGLKVIYDACHAFGVKVQHNSVLNYGDLSVLSFHATKVFNTFEGGAIVCHDDKTKKRIDFLKNFGFADEVTVVAPGINAKMNEFQAALGLLQLRHFANTQERRRALADCYRSRLRGIEGIRFLNPVDGVDHNYAYFPIFIDSERFGRTRDQLYDALKIHNIHSRRYFYPLISNFPSYRNLQSAQPQNLPTANAVADQVLCLPFYPDLPMEIAEEIVRLISNEKE
jgi:dTDP-4-amino-4,6-dideoxygalactose transaminase